MEKQNIIVGIYIKQAREAKNITQSKLAEELDISIHTLSEYETMQHIPDVNILCNIADVLDVSLDDLVKWEKEKNS